MPVLLLVFALLLASSALSWAQAPAQLINGNRTHAGATNYGVTTGTGAAYILTLNAAIPGYVDGSCYLLEAHTANTGPATLNVNSRGARALKKKVGAALVDLEANDIITGQLVQACTDGTVMQTDLGAPVSGGSGGHIIQEEGVALTPRPALNFTGALMVCSDDIPNNRTVCNLTGAGGGTLTHIGSCTGPQCFTSGTPSTTQWWGASTAPSPPVAGQTVLYIDSVTQNFSAKTSANVITHGVQTKTLVPNEFLVSIAASGAVTSARPSLANLADAADVVTLVGVQRLANKQVNPREVLLSGTNITPNLDQGNVFIMNTFTGNLTINCPTGTGGNPVPGHEIEFRFLSATPHTLTWNACYAAEYDLAIPTVTRGDGVIYDRIKFIYNSNSVKWGLVAALPIPGSGLTLDVQEIDGSPSGSFHTLKFSNGSMTDEGGGIARIVTGGGGGGDVFGPASSVNNGLPLYSGTTGKVLKQSTDTGLPKLNAGALELAVPGTDYVVPSGTVATAGALSGPTTNCSVGQAPRGIDAAGNAEDCFTPGGGGGTVDISGTPTAGQVAVFVDANTLQGTSVLDVQYTGNHVSTSGTVSTGVEYVTTGAGGITRTLPAAASATNLRQFLVIKEDAGVGALTIAPAGSDTINGVTTPLTVTTRWAGYLLIENVATGWSAVAQSPTVGGGSSFTSPVTVTSTSATALAVGPNGATNPTLQVDASVASEVTGVKITGNVTGAPILIEAIGTGSNEILQLRSKGTGNLILQTPGGGASVINAVIGGNTEGQFAGNGFLVPPPAAQTIAEGNTIAGDACGGLKRITAASAVNTNATNTFTAPGATNNGCILHVCNTGTNNIVLKTNALFKSAGAADVTLTGDDCVTVGSDSTVWRQLTPVVVN